MSVPASLRKRGITRMVSNCGADQEVVLQGGLLFTLFGKELMERLQPTQPEPKRRRVLCQPNKDCL